MIRPSLARTLDRATVLAGAAMLAFAAGAALLVTLTEPRRDVSPFGAKIAMRVEMIDGEAGR